MSCPFSLFLSLFEFHPAVTGQFSAAFGLTSNHTTINSNEDGWHSGISGTVRAFSHRAVRTLSRRLRDGVYVQGTLLFRCILPLFPLYFLHAVHPRPPRRAFRCLGSLRPGPLPRRSRSHRSPSLSGTQAHLCPTPAPFGLCIPLRIGCLPQTAPSLA